MRTYFGNGKKLKNADDVWKWYETYKMQIPMVYQLAEIVFCIPPSQIENERDFSLAGVIRRSRRASFTAKNLGMLVYINKNKDVVEKLEKTNIFEVNIDDIQDEIEQADACEDDEDGRTK